jgi:hypothetical protein
MEKKREPPKIRVFPDLQRLTGYRAIALPHANEIHIDAKYYGTPLGDAIIEHEKRHIEYAFEVAESKHGNLTILKNNLWDIWDSMVRRLAEIRMELETRKLKRGK